MKCRFKRHIERQSHRRWHLIFKLGRIPGFRTMIKKIKPLLFLSFSVSMLCSCASLTTPDEQIISITTDCKGRELPTACIASNGTETYNFETPAEVKIKRSPNNLRIACRGGLLDHATYTSSPAIGLPFYGNIFIGGGLGALADIQSNKIYEYPSAINIEPVICKYL